MEPVAWASGEVADTTLQPGGAVDNAVGTVGEVAGEAIPPRRRLSPAGRPGSPPSR